MNDDIYKTPEAELVTPINNNVNDDLYIVSPKKFTILYLSTMGAYTTYWIYKNWKKWNDAHKIGAMPIARAIFYIFFVHSLFAVIEDKLREKDIEYSWNPSFLATIFVLITIFDRVYDRLPSLGELDLYLGAFSFSLLGLSYYILLVAQKAVNISDGDPEGSSNSEFTFANYVWIVIGLILWIVVISFLLMAFGLIDNSFVLELLNSD